MRAMQINSSGDVPTHAGWMIFCPACQRGHLFDSRWEFNGDVERPTFTPSMHIMSNDPTHPGYNSHAVSSTCHSYVTDGKIKFLDDCSHDLKGQCVDLPDFTASSL